MLSRCVALAGSILFVVSVAGSQKSPVASKGPILYECTQTGGTGSSLSATFYQTKPAMVLLERDNQSRPAFRVKAASGAKYEGTETIFWESKGEASVNWSGVEIKCKPVEESSPAASLVGKKWKLIDVNGVAVKSGKPYIEFDGQTNRYSGDGGCNRIAGGFELKGPRIKFSQGISTKRACIDNDIQKIETDFFRTLSEVTSFQIRGEILRLFKGDHPVLTFSAEAKGTTGPVNKSAP